MPFATTGDIPPAADNVRMTAVELLDGRQYLVVSCAWRQVVPPTDPSSFYVLDMSSRCWTRYAGPLTDCAHLAALDIDGRPHVVTINDSLEVFWVIDAERLVSGDSTMVWPLAWARAVSYTHLTLPTILLV